VCYAKAMIRVAFTIVVLASTLACSRARQEELYRPPPEPEVKPAPIAQLEAPAAVAVGNLHSPGGGYGSRYQLENAQVAFAFEAVEKLKAETFHTGLASGERQEAHTACKSDPACLAEFGRKLGVEYVFDGVIMADEKRIEATIVRSSDGAQVARSTSGTEGQDIKRLVIDLVAQLNGDAPRPDEGNITPL
jgi:hypothetical protein